MMLNKHRQEFTLHMTAEELIQLVALLEGYQRAVLNVTEVEQAPTVKRVLSNFLWELTYYKRYAEAEERYLRQEEEKIT